LTDPHSRTQALTHAFVDQAYTLAREADHTLTLDAWRRFATPLAAELPTEMRAPGVMLVLRKDLIRGLATFRWKPDVDGARLLAARDIVIMDRARKERVSQDLLGGLIEIALRDHCSRVHAELPRSSAWLDTMWSDPEGSIYRLPIECIRLSPDIRTPADDGTVVTLHLS
jgi:hypothetical protein